MAISDILGNVPPDARKGPICAVCEALVSLPESESAALLALLSNPLVRYTTLADALADDPDNPLNLPPHVLSNHSRGRCAARTRLR